MVGSQNLRSFREDLVAGRTWKEEHARETLYDMDIVRMYYQIILLCKFTIIPKVIHCQLSAASHVVITFVFRRCQIWLLSISTHP